jgi:thioredoxin reductase (NADPH)
VYRSQKFEHEIKKLSSYEGSKMSKIYDVIILGGGPAGLAAGLYAGRSRLSVLIIEKGQDGGQIAITDEIENYPGQIVDGESGPSLVARMTAQAEKFGAERVSDLIKSVELEGETKLLKGAKGDYHGKNVIIATGAYSRPIGCKGEGEYVGKGVSYCATCDANFFEDFEVFVVGGGDSAVEEALYLSKFARKVTIIHRRDELRAAKSIQEKAFANPKIAFIWNSVVDELYGDEILQSMTIKDVKTGEISRFDADEEDGMFGLFGFIGTVPHSKLFEGIIEMDKRGYIITDDDMHTNIEGVYAAGDVRVKSLRQVVTAAADGAIAAIQVERSLSDYF